MTKLRDYEHTYYWLVFLNEKICELAPSAFPAYRHGTSVGYLEADPYIHSDWRDIDEAEIPSYWMAW